MEALDNGAKYIVPCSSSDEARKIRNEYKEKDRDALLSGERLGATPEGFDLNISPRDMKEAIVKDRAIIYCSTNLTRILADCGFAKILVIGGVH